MTWPEDVATRNITFSGGQDAETSDMTYPARVIISCNSRITHQGEGIPLLGIPEVKGASFSLPITNQNPGVWLNSKGQPLVTDEDTHSHSYTATIEYRANGRWIAGKTIENLLVPDEDEDLDLDLVVNTSSGFNQTGIVASLPDTWSELMVSAQAAAAAAEASAAAAANDAAEAATALSEVTEYLEGYPPILVLGPDDDVPPGTAEGTIIIRTVI